MFGLSKENFNKLIKVIKKYNIDFVIFGSRARGNYKCNSDIDIAVKNEVTKDEKYKIMDDFDKIEIPYKIDLLFMQDIKNKDLRESIEREGITL
jgi:predicted nucleotidyltransferase